jgi:hypothetical protein
VSAANPIAPSPALPLVYVGASVALTTTGKSILALIKALGGEYVAVTGLCSELTITNDPGSANAILVCDSFSAGAASPPTSYGVYLNIGQSKTYPNGADLSRIYVAAAAGTATLDVEVNNGCSTRW